MARKFKRSLRSNDLKKRLATKQNRAKSEPVLSISLIKKESIEKANKFFKGIIGKLKSFRLKLAR